MELKIIRIELLGDANKETYDKLHTFMERRGWKRGIYTNLPNTPKSGPLPLPTATYCGDSEQRVDVIALELSNDIKTTIWTKPRVLVMGVGTNWSLAGF